MKRRLVAVLAAVLSAALGAALLLTYVTGADRRAMAGLQPVQVLVTTGVVPAGTSGTALADLVKVKSLPSTALVPGAVQDVSTLAGLVSTAELAPGEQVLASRFVDPTTRADSGRPTVPNGQQQVSVDLEPQRVLGGDLGPGARVAVFTTVEKKTRLAIRSALVLRVDTAGGSEDGASATAPADGRVRLVLAVTRDGAEALISGADTGTVWCSLLSAAPTSPVPDAAAAKGPTS